jgi:2-polyprenyl-6-methoxyphenol hydroxylase-like FAD-dependent oxidoreductase
VAELTATVVGGGIAGLASAIGLVRSGWRVTVLEQAAFFGEVGAGVAVTVNGMTALDALGVGDAVRAAGARIRSAGFQDCRGRWLLRLPNLPVEREPTLWLQAVHRRRLHAALLHATDGATLLTGATATAVDPGTAGASPARVTYRTETGEHFLETDLVVGADGLRSTVRAGMFADVRPRYGGATSWRAVIDDAQRIDDRFVAAWGAGVEFGALRISPTQVYWYGYFTQPEGGGVGDELNAARAMFADWPPWVADTVAATTPEQLMRHDVYDLGDGISTYVCGRVVLAGDAAHAMLPTSGQGISSAVEDAVCIGRIVAVPVARGAELARALSAYDQARRPRCRRLARQAVTIARFGAHLSGGWRQGLRKEVLRITPRKAVVKAGRAILDWTPPLA